MATALPLSKIMTEDLAAIRNRIGSLGVQRFKELSPSAWARENAGDMSIKRPLLIILITVFSTGMLLGWLVIGWWLWPVEWTSYHPEKSSGNYQQMLINWAADRYWQTGDAAQVQPAFANWPRQDLAKLLLTMQRQTQDVEARRHLIALTYALGLPVTESSLATFIFSQPLMLLSIFLSVAPLLAAFTYINLPRLRRRDEQAAEIVVGAAPAPESLDDMLVEVELDAEAAQAQGQEQAEEEKKKEEEQAAEESDGQSSGLGDLASLFEEEDTSINVLEAFCKGMPDMGVDELLSMGSDLLHRLRESNRSS
jgi:hypothetical protein